MEQKRFHKTLVIIVLISFAVSPALFLGDDNRNLLLIGIMSISPLLILLNFHLKKIDFLLIVYTATIIVFPLIIHPESMRWSTVLYSAMFCITFMVYHRSISVGSLSREYYIKILKYIIYAYFFVLLIQQFCVLLGLPIFNLRNYNPIEPWKLNSLAAEPSHSARIIALLMFCFITIKELQLGGRYIFQENFKKDKWVWLAFIWCMTTIGSALAFLLIPIIFMKFLRIRNMIPLLSIIIIIALLADQFGNSALIRAYKTVAATISLDENKIIEADHSASQRIIPIIVNLKKINLATLDGWFGHGIDYVSSFLYKIIPGIPKGSSGGGMFQVAVEFGIISASIFIYFSLKYTISSDDFITLIFWFLMILLNGVNSQITWLTIILLFTNKYYQSISHKENERSYSCNLRI